MIEALCKMIKEYRNRNGGYPCKALMSEELFEMLKEEIRRSGMIREGTEETEEPEETMITICGARIETLPWMEGELAIICPDRPSCDGRFTKG